MKGESREETKLWNAILREIDHGNRPLQLLILFGLLQDEIRKQL